MRYRDAKKLHNEDEVTVKATGRVIRVVSVDIVDFPIPVPPFCVIRGSDGRLYLHTEVK